MEHGWSELWDSGLPSGQPAPPVHLPDGRVALVDVDHAAAALGDGVAATCQRADGTDYAAVITRLSATAGAAPWPPR